MKRSCKDGSSSSQPKHTGQPQMRSWGEQRLTINDGLAYINLVKEVFRDKKEKYHDFLQAMRDFKAERIDTPGAIARVKELFKGHRDLILRFNIFLPNGYEITLPLEDEQPPPKKPREFAQEEVEMSFTRADNGHRRRGAKEKNHIHYDHESFFMHPNSSVFQYASPLKRMKISREDASTSSQPKQPVVLSSGRTHMRQPQMRSGDGERLIISDALAYVKAVKEVFRDKTEKYHDFLEFLWDFKAQRIDTTGLAARMKELFKGHKDLILGFNTFLPTEYKITLPLEDEQPHKKKSRLRTEDSGANHDTDENFGMHPRSSAVEDISCMNSMCSGVFGYLEEAKESLRNPDDFQEFLKYLRIYSKEIITKEELKLLVGNLLGKYADLIEGFNEFLAQHENNEG